MPPRTTAWSSTTAMRTWSRRSRGNHRRHRPRRRASAGHRIAIAGFPQHQRWPGSSSSRRVRIAYWTSSARVESPSLRITWARWVSAVRGEIQSMLRDLRVRVPEREQARDLAFALGERRRRPARRRRPGGQQAGAERCLDVLLAGGDGADRGHELRVGGLLQDVAARAGGEGAADRRAARRASRARGCGPAVRRAERRACGRRRRPSASAGPSRSRRAGGGAPRRRRGPRSPPRPRRACPPPRPARGGAQSARRAWSSTRRTLRSSPSGVATRQAYRAVPRRPVRRGVSVPAPRAARSPAGRACGARAPRTPSPAGGP